MSREEVAAKLIEVMKKATEEVVDWDAITEASSIETMGIDSLTTLDLLFYIKEDLGLDIDVNELTGIETFKDMVDFIGPRLESA